LKRDSVFSHFTGGEAFVGMRAVPHCHVLTQVSAWRLQIKPIAPSSFSWDALGVYWCKSCEKVVAVGHGEAGLLSYETLVSRME
jgi:hypothetical protein